MCVSPCQNLIPYRPTITEILDNVRLLSYLKQNEKYIRVRESVIGVRLLAEQAKQGDKSPKGSAAEALSATTQRGERVGELQAQVSR